MTTNIVHYQCLVSQLPQYITQENHPTINEISFFGWFSINDRLTSKATVAIFKVKPHSNAKH